MTHELLHIFEAFKLNKKAGNKAVLATVVQLQGSSYRRPGVRMLLLDTGKMVGAVSGGCVEKEIEKQAQSVFESNMAKLMTYDGRYRLGCEGILYILIEPFDPEEPLLKIFQEYITKRLTFEIISQFSIEKENHSSFGSFIKFDDKIYPLLPTLNKNKDLNVFKDIMLPRLKLVIIGAEHDAVQLSTYASLTGWEVHIIAPLSEEKKLNDFSGASDIHFISPDDISEVVKDNNTAVVLMTHSYVKDLQFLIALSKRNLHYLGLLGPKGRRDKLLSELVEYNSAITVEFLEQIHGPAGLDIGGETPQEIAVSIVAEILAILRKKKPDFLKNKKGNIHSL